MNCIIVEDQLPAQRILKKYIQDAGGFELIGCYTDGLEAMEVLSSQNIDVMFLDIHLPKISGIDFLKSLTNPPRVIFTTAFQDYALESYEFNVVDYLLVVYLVGFNVTNAFLYRKWFPHLHIKKQFRIPFF